MMCVSILVMIELTLYKIFVPKKNPILAFFLYVITMVIIISSLLFCLNKGIIKESDISTDANSTTTTSYHQKLSAYTKNIIKRLKP